MEPRKLTWINYFCLKKLFNSIKRAWAIHNNILIRLKATLRINFRINISNNKSHLNFSIRILHLLIRRSYEEFSIFNTRNNNKETLLQIEIKR